MVYLSTLVYVYVVIVEKRMIVHPHLKGNLASLKGFDLPLRVLSNGKGMFFIGTFKENFGIITKESKETWNKQFQAEDALCNGKWTRQSVPKLKYFWN